MPRRWWRARRSKEPAGIDLLHVPYRSSPPAVQDVLGGRVSMVFTDMATGLPHHRSGALSGLANDPAASAARCVPDYPRWTRPASPASTWTRGRRFSLPANTRRDIVTRLNTRARKIIDGPEVKAQIAATGFEAFSSSTEEIVELHQGLSS